MKTNKNAQLKEVLFFKNYALIKVQKMSLLRIFSSSLDKSVFIENNPKETYTLSLDGNSVNIHLYVVVDTNDGFCLNPVKILPYFEALNLISHYE